MAGLSGLQPYLSLCPPHACASITLSFLFLPCWRLPAQGLCTGCALIWVTLTLLSPPGSLCRFQLNHTSSRKPRRSDTHIHAALLCRGRLVPGEVNRTQLQLGRAPLGAMNCECLRAGGTRSQYRNWGEDHH